MRGQGGGFCTPGVRRRITPADAGTSLRGWYAQSEDTDHPRGCGDKSKICVISYLAVGSPPRMRGQAVRPKETKSEKRITPADAGTSVKDIVMF